MAVQPHAPQRLCIRAPLFNGVPRPVHLKMLVVTGGSLQEHTWVVKFVSYAHPDGIFEERAAKYDSSAVDCIGLSLAVHGLKAGEFFNDDQRLGMARFQGPRKSISISKQIAFLAQSKFNLLMNFLRRTSKTLHPDAARW